MALESLDLARDVVDTIAERKGTDIILLDIRELSIIADYFVIASVASERQGKALINSIREEVKEDFEQTPLHVEGETASGWVLMDYGDVMIHIFTPEVRAYYDLEGFWKDAPIVVRMI